MPQYWASPWYFSPFPPPKGGARMIYCKKKKPPPALEWGCRPLFKGNWGSPSKKEGGKKTFLWPQQGGKRWKEKTRWTPCWEWPPPKEIRSPNLNPKNSGKLGKGVKWAPTNPLTLREKLGRLKPPFGKGQPTFLEGKFWKTPRKFREPPFPQEIENEGSPKKIIPSLRDLIWDGWILKLGSNYRFNKFKFRRDTIKKSPNSNTTFQNLTTKMGSSYFFKSQFLTPTFCERIP